MKASRMAALLLAGWSLAACAGTETAAPAPQPSADAALLAGGGPVRRDGGRLVITLDNGATVEFVDYRGRPQAGQYWDSVAHLYRGRLGGGRFHLVERSAYGRTHGVLVDTATGASWSIPGGMVLSPDGDRLLVLPDEAGEKRLQIWDLGGARPKVELDVLPRRPVRFESWEPDRIALRVPDDGAVRTVWLERSWGAWNLPEPLR